MKFLNDVLMILGGLLVLAGGVFFLQGINVITSRSFMRGDWHWAIYGGIMVVAGAALLVFIQWKRNPKK